MTKSSPVPNRESKSDSGKYLKPPLGLSSTPSYSVITETIGQDFETNVNYKTEAGEATKKGEKKRPVNDVVRAARYHKRIRAGPSLKTGLESESKIEELSSKISERATSRTSTGVKVRARLCEGGELSSQENRSRTNLAANTPGKAQRKTKTEIEEKIEKKEQEKSKVVHKAKTRKTKGETETEKLPLAKRSIGMNVFLGAHVSAAGGVHNAVQNSIYIGGNAFALFLKSQRRWTNPPLQDGHSILFKSGCQDNKYDSTKHVVPHGSYLVNLAHTDKARADQAYAAFLDDLKRCNQLGIKLYNLHPGNCASSSRDEAIQQLATKLNHAHQDPRSGDTITLLETMAATSGNTLGGTFEELKAIIDRVVDKSRVGVCLDTCHIFAAGYDLRSAEDFKKTINKFDTLIGLKYLKALHLNDSKAPLGSGRDLHANIGTGFLGLRAFHNIMNENRLQGLPMILETPINIKDATGTSVENRAIWAQEIKLLESLIGMDVKSKEFKKIETELCNQGEKERNRIYDQMKRKQKQNLKKR